MEWPDGKVRCSWANPKNERYIRYHDEVWGVPVHDDQKLFEMLILECFQAGLDLEQVCAYGEEKLEEIRQDPGIIRNRLKIRAAVANAKVFRAIQQEYGSFSDYLWNWTDGQVVHEVGESCSPLSDAISRDLKRRGMKFVGTTIVYAYLQAVGVVCSHEEGCFLAGTEGDRPSG